jgi:hypothetical protein
MFTISFFLLVLSDVICVSFFSCTVFSVFLYLGSCTPFSHISTFLCFLDIRVGATTTLEGGSGRAVGLPSFVEGF